MEDLHAFTVDLMTRAPVFYMASVDEQSLPQVRAMENLRCQDKFPHPSKVIQEQEDDSLVSFISTNTSSKKTKTLRARFRSRSLLLYAR